MSRSSRMSRGDSSQRWKRFLAASLCVGSFLTGELLFGAEPTSQPRASLRPATILPVAHDAELAPTAAAKSTGQTSSRKGYQVAPAIATDDSRPTGKPTPAAKPLAPTPAAAPKLQPVAAAAAEPAKLPTADGTLAPIVRASDMQRRPGQPAAQTAPSGPLAPIVSASSMPRPQAPAPSTATPKMAAPTPFPTTQFGSPSSEPLPTPAMKREVAPPQPTLATSPRPTLDAPKPVAPATETAAARSSRTASPWMQELDAPREFVPAAPEAAPQPIPSRDPSLQAPASLAQPTVVPTPAVPTEMTAPTQSHGAIAAAAERATELLSPPAEVATVQLGKPTFEPLATAVPTVPAPMQGPSQGPSRSAFIPIEMPAEVAATPAPTVARQASAPAPMSAPIASRPAAPPVPAQLPEPASAPTMIPAIAASAPIATAPTAPREFTAEQPQHLAPVVSSAQARIDARKQADARTMSPYAQSIAPMASRHSQARPAALVQPEPMGPMLPEALPEGSPFEVIDESGVLTVRVRRSRLLRTKVDIYRTAVVDESICDVVQFTPREVSIIGKSTGATHVTFWFDDPNSQPLTWLVKVEPDAEDVKKDEQTYKLLEDVINEMFPDSKIQLMVVASKLIVRGQAKDSEEAAQIISIIRAQTGGTGNNGLGGAQNGLAEGVAANVLSDSATGNSNRSRLQVINMLRVPGVHQVALKVKIAELNRTAARGFGVDLQTDISFSDSEKGSSLLLDSILNMAGGQAPALLTQIDGDEIQIGIRYLQQHGVVKLLAEPTLVTLSGRPATFIAGGEFAVPTVVGSAGLNAVTTDFRAFGAIISFMPTVIDKDRIRLEVAPEFSQINQDLNVGGTPGLRVRAATTTVEMREGQTLAIAGLLEDNMNGTTVGDLPFLAKIFGRRGMQRNETELLILVSPELVHPMEPEEVPPLPGFDVTEPTNGQFFLHGDLEGNPTQDYRSTVWPRLRKRYGSGGPAMTSGPFGHGQ